VRTESKPVDIGRLARTADVDDGDAVTFAVGFNPLRGTVFTVTSEHKHASFVHGNADPLAIVIGSNEMGATAGAKAVTWIQERTLAVSVAVEFEKLPFGHGWLNPTRMANSLELSQVTTLGKVPKEKKTSRGRRIYGRRTRMSPEAGKSTSAVISWLRQPTEWSHFHAFTERPPGGWQLREEDSLNLKSALTCGRAFP